MNILGLVFSLLLILSYAYYASWDKHNSSSRLRRTYLAHQEAYRKILNDYESELYRNLRHVPIPGREKPKSGNEKKGSPLPLESQWNQPCSRINLWPLVEEGKETHPILYELMAKLLSFFYSSLFDKERFEYTFLDHLLKCAKTAHEPLIELEKLSLSDEMQPLFYRMLKGTQDPNGFPPLLDYVKFTPEKNKICLFHAHPNLLAIFFGPKAGAKLYAELHKENPSALTAELIDEICSESHRLSADSKLLDIIELGRPNHKKNGQMAFAAEKDQVVIRKTLRVNSR